MENQDSTALGAPSSSDDDDDGGDQDDHDLALAAWEGDTERTMSLLASGRDPNQRSDVGCPAMGMAATNGHADVIHHLLLYRADIAAIDNLTGNTPLHFGAENGHRPALELLLEQNAPVDPANKRGETALMRAAVYGRTDCVRLLLVSSADRLLTDKAGQTALDKAQAHAAAAPDKAQAHAVVAMLSKEDWMFTQDRIKQARNQILIDRAVKPGTHLHVEPHGEGVYVAFEKNFGRPNVHVIRFASGGEKRVKLKDKKTPSEWSVLAGPSSSPRKSFPVAEMGTPRSSAAKPAPDSTSPTGGSRAPDLGEPPPGLGRKPALVEPEPEPEPGPESELQNHDLTFARATVTVGQDSLTSFLGSWYPALKADLDELGAEEAEDLKGLEPQDIELLASKLKKLQRPKFHKKMASFDEDNPKAAAISQSNASASDQMCSGGRNRSVSASPRLMTSSSDETHGKPIGPTLSPSRFDFDLVFSNKTASDSLCLEVRQPMEQSGKRVWQQKTNIPKDSENWFSEWYPSAVKAQAIVCFISADYLKSPYCMKEWRVAESKNKLLVVACEPLPQIREVNPSEYPHASNALAYLDGGGQVIFHGQDDTVAEILKVIGADSSAAVDTGREDEV
jgi:hypothetical protein